MSQGKQIPNELLEMILKHSTENTRNSIRACSANSKLLVEQCRLNRVFWMHIDDCEIRINEMNGSIKETFKSCEQKQKRLLEILKPIDCIKKLSIETELSTQLKLINTNEQQQKLRVEVLHFDEYSSDQILNVLQQIEPVYLREVIIESDGGNSAIYDTPQIIQAEKLTSSGVCSIQKDQLAKLEARYIEIENLECSPLKYIRKCTRRTCSVLPTFRFHGEKGCRKLKRLFPMFSKKVLLKTSNPHAKLKLQLDSRYFCSKYSVSGYAQFDSERAASISTRPDPFMPRRIESLQIEYRNCCWKISVARRNYDNYEYNFKSLEKTQKRINEILENADYIKKFTIDFLETKESIQWEARKEKLTVSYLVVSVSNSAASIHGLLSQIDPFHLKTIEINAKDEGNEQSVLLDTPQSFLDGFKIFKKSYFIGIDDRVVMYRSEDVDKVHNSPYVTVNNAMLRDDQLLKMNADVFRCTGANLLTASGINKYIKKCVLSLNEKNHHFILSGLADDINRAEIVRGFCTKWSDRIIKSEDSKFALRLEYYKNGVRGSRYSLLNGF